MDSEFVFRPYTTRRYIHPPKSERMFTVWPEGKFIFGDVYLDFKECNINPATYFNRTFVGGGLWFAHGDADTAFTYGNTVFETSESGAPVHRMHNTFRDMKMSLEAFCDTKRKSTLFIKLTAENIGKTEMKEKVSLFVRTGYEDKLVFGKCDMYNHYQPDINVWKGEPATWKEQNGGFTDGERTLTVSAYTAFSEKEGKITLFENILPGEKKEIIFSFDKGEKTGFDYEAEKKETEKFWEKELSKINKLPDELKNNAETLRMIRHITAQILQMFTCPRGTDFVIPRQGGLRRVIWPTEALSMIEALARIGDFSDYIEPVIDFYFNFKQLESGEIEQVGFSWGSITAAVLYSFSKYCTLTGNAAFFGKYRDKAYKAFRYIKDLRHTTTDSETTAGGLFPPLQGIDWSQVFQCWCSTDIFNLFGEDEFANACRQFSDSAYSEAAEDHDAYVSDMRRHFRKYYDAQSGSDKLYLPLMPVGDDTELVKDFYPELHHGRFIFCGVVDKYEDVLRAYNCLIERGITKDGVGLYGHMAYKNEKKGIWYLSFPDYYWFEIWMKYGRRDKAKEIIDAQLTFGMTPEYVFCERIDTESPTFTPWMPNGSAMGRILIMLMKYYGEDK